MGKRVETDEMTPRSRLARSRVGFPRSASQWASLIDLGSLHWSLDRPSWVPYCSSTSLGKIVIGMFREDLDPDGVILEGVSAIVQQSNAAGQDKPCSDGKRYTGLVGGGLSATLEGVQG